MFTIVGGCYFEDCGHPKWREIFGSGVRAALAISDVANQMPREDESDPSLALITCLTDGEAKKLNSKMIAGGIMLKPISRPATVSFTYPHALRPPYISPPAEEMFEIPDTVHDIANGLVFGMIECRPRVRASGRLVYDPQGGVRVTPYSATGHSASAAALVANRREAMRMASDLGFSASTSPSSLTVAKYLRRVDHLDVVVVKDGVKGATVVFDGGHIVIDSFPTDRVFKIGSGDVFSAVFAYHWAEMGLTPLESARYASLATAYYCSGQGFVVPSSFHEQEPLFKAAAESLLESFPRLSKPRRVYLAGPLYTVAQIAFLDDMRVALEDHDINVFSPKDEVGLLNAERDFQAIADGDLLGLDECNIVFALLDGLDAGTLFEIGYAVGSRKNKAIIGFAQNVSPNDLPMLRGTGCHIYDDLTTAIYHAAWLYHRK